MALKRTYQVQSKYTRGSKRARTLESQVNSLKKQVTVNKKELKYYDGRIAVPPQPAQLTNKSFFKDVVDSDGLSDNPVFIGRKAHIKKLEIRIKQENTDIFGSFMIWREKRLGKAVDQALYPLGIDPEYHTMLRYWERSTDDTSTLKHLVIDFGQQGRLVEFDEQTSATSTGDIVTGDIKISSTLGYAAGTLDAVQFRVWYTDN